jgi:hypothetical protein
VIVWMSIFVGVVSVSSRISTVIVVVVRSFWWGPYVICVKAWRIKANVLFTLSMLSRSKRFDKAALAEGDDKAGQSKMSPNLVAQQMFLPTHVHHHHY